MDTIFAIIGCAILSVIGVIGISIKEKTNVFEALYQFFGEWGLVIKDSIIFLFILFVISCIFA
jgi:hypothetical protein